MTVAHAEVGGEAQDATPSVKTNQSGFSRKHPSTHLERLQSSQCCCERTAYSTIATIFEHARTLGCVAIAPRFCPRGTFAEFFKRTDAAPVFVVGVGLDGCLNSLSVQGFFTNPLDKQAIRFMYVSETLKQKTRQTRRIGWRHIPCPCPRSFFNKNSVALVQRARPP